MHWNGFRRFHRRRLNVALARLALAALAGALALFAACQDSARNPGEDESRRLSRAVAENGSGADSDVGAVLRLAAPGLRTAP